MCALWACCILMLKYESFIFSCKIINALLRLLINDTAFVYHIFIFDFQSAWNKDPSAFGVKLPALRVSVCSFPYSVCAPGRPGAQRYVCGRGSPGAPGRQ